MKVNWDNIIQEDHTPSRVSRRLVKMLGGFLPTSAPSGPVLGGTPLDQGLAAASFIGGPATAVIGSLISGIATAATPFMGDYQSRYSPEDYIKTGAEVKADYDAWEFNRLLQLKSQFPTQPWRWEKQLRDMGYDDSRYRLAAVDPIVEAAKAAKQREEDRIIVQQNETYAAMLRNEQNQKDASDRALARTRTITAQNTARVRAALQNTTTIQGELERIKAAATATAEAKGQNLKSLHALATQRGVVAATEAEQQKMIQANSAQIFAQQNAEVARLRAEALAKQGQIRAVAPVVSRKAKAPQVKFGGSKSSGYVQKLIEMDKLDPEAELFDADLIQDPSKYIQTQLYEKSGRVRQGIKKIKEIQQKNIVKSAVKKYVLSFKNRSIGAIKNIDENTMEEFMNSFKRDGVEGAAYSAFTIVGELFFLHLLRKYKNDCYVVSKNEKKLYIAGIAIRDSLAGIKTDDTDFPEILDDCIKSKSPLIVIPFKLPDHLNMLIYRPQQNTMERFEPHGEQTGFSASPAVNKKKNEKIDQTLTIYFNHKRFDKVFIRPGVPPFKYLNAAELKLGRGFQSIEAEQKRAYGKKLGVGYDGFCMMWSYFYLELCMRFPNMTGKEVVDRAFQILETRGAQGFLNHILAYLEGSEKEIAKIIKDFSFKTIQSTRGSKKSAALSALKSYRDWYDKQITEIVESKKKQRGGELICSCNGPSTCGGVK